MAKNNKNTKWVFPQWRYWDIDAMTYYLNEQAEQGWRLTRYSFGLTFARDETAKNEEYRVEVFRQGSEMDLKASPKTEEFAEYCKAAGWELVDSYGKFCIFRKLCADAKPIFTEEERYEAVRKGTTSQNIWLGIGLVLLYASEYFQIVTNASTFFDPLILSVYVFLLFGLVGGFFLVSTSNTFLSKARKQLENGDPVTYAVKQPDGSLVPHARWILYADLICLGVIFLIDAFSRNWFFFTVLLFFFVVCGGFGVWLFRSRPGKAAYVGTMVGIVIVLLLGLSIFILSAGIIGIGNSSDKPSLTMSNLNLQEPTNAKTDFTKNRTVFGEMEDYDIYGNTFATMHYSYYTSNYDWLLCRLERENTQATRYRDGMKKMPSEVAKQWGADVVYYGIDEPSAILVRKGDSLLYLYCTDRDGNPAPEWNEDTIEVVRTHFQLN